MAVRVGEDMWTSARLAAYDWKIACIVGLRQKEKVSVIRSMECSRFGNEEEVVFQRSGPQHH